MMSGSGKRSQPQMGFTRGSGNPRASSPTACGDGSAAAAGGTAGGGCLEQQQPACPRYFFIFLMDNGNGGRLEPLLLKILLLAEVVRVSNRSPKLLNRSGLKHEPLLLKALQERLPTVVSIARVHE